MYKLLQDLIFAKQFRFYIGDDDNAAGAANVDTALEEEGDGEATNTDAEDTGTGEGDEGTTTTSEDEGTAEGDGVSGEEGAGNVTKPNLMIPKSRFDSAQSRARSAEGKLKEYEARDAAAQAAAPKDTTAQVMDERLVEIDQKIEQARLDGDADAIVRLSTEARGIERELFTVIAREEAAHAGTAAQENVKLDTLIENLETTYDILNPDSENFDKEVITEVLDLQSAFVARGDTPSVAMLKAVSYVIPEERVTDEVGAKRTTNVKKNLDAAKRIAPGTNDIGNDSSAGGITTDTPDVSQMSEEEFDALPESTLKRLRGDAG
jgi:hypothetical protein